MKKVVFTLFFSAFSILIFCQDFEVPKNYTLVKAEDYTTYEQVILKSYDWLMTTPVNEQAEKRKEVNAFLLKWITGSPTVSIEIKQEILTFMGSSPDLLLIFMGGWTKYALESKDFNNKIAGNIAGIESVVEFYTKNKNSLPKDKNIEKYIKMKEKGTLKEYIVKNV